MRVSIHAAAWREEYNVMAEVHRIDLPWGYVLFGQPGLNEVTIVNTQPGDPPGLRFVSPDGNCGKWSFCIGDDPATAVELLLFQGKKDERTRGHADHNWGEGTIHVRGPLRWNGVDADGRVDDGMYPTVLFLHDYTWVKNLSSGPFPNPPIVLLPPPSAPVPLPDPNQPPPMTEAERIQRVEDVRAMRDEFATMDLDDDGVQSYLIGRKGLREFHDDEMRRFGGHNSNKHRPGRPY